MYHKPTDICTKILVVVPHLPSPFPTSYYYIDLLTISFLALHPDTILSLYALHSIILFTQSWETPDTSIGTLFGTANA